MVIRCWRDHCQLLGIKLLYKCGGKFVGERTRVPLSSWMTELCFQMMLQLWQHRRTVKVTIELDRVVQVRGLTIGIPNTKFLVAGK